LVAGRLQLRRLAKSTSCNSALIEVSKLKKEDFIESNKLPLKALTALELFIHALVIGQ